MPLTFLEIHIKIVIEEKKDVDAYVTNNHKNNSDSYDTSRSYFNL